MCTPVFNLWGLLAVQVFQFAGFSEIRDVVMVGNIGSFLREQMTGAPPWNRTMRGIPKPARSRADARRRVFLAAHQSKKNRQTKTNSLTRPRRYRWQAPSSARFQASVAGSVAASCEIMGGPAILFRVLLHHSQPISRLQAVHRGTAGGDGFIPVGWGHPMYREYPPIALRFGPSFSWV
jgi:hypothetical protein